MAISFELWVCNLLAKFLADTFVLFGLCQTAGTIPTLGFQALFDLTDNFLILVKTHSHRGHPFRFSICICVIFYCIVP